LRNLRAFRYFTQILIGFSPITILLALSVSAPDIEPTYQVAINKTFYPYHFVNDKQNPNGIMVELWQLWAKKQDVKGEFIALNWQQTIKVGARGGSRYSCWLVSKFKQS
jgi:hypothetical protein